MTARVGKRVRKLKPCGTPPAYQRHLRHNEPIDEKCRIAHNEYLRRVYSGEIAAEREYEAIRQQALEALAHRHPEEFNQLVAKATAEADCNDDHQCTQ